MVTLELTKQQRTDAIASMQRYFEENLEPIGDMPAGLLLNFFLEEVGPAIYNQAIADAQTRLTSVSPTSTANSTPTNSSTGPAPTPNANPAASKCSFFRPPNLSEAEGLDELQSCVQFLIRPIRSSSNASRRDISAMRLNHEHIS